VTSFDERYARLSPAQRELFDAWLASEPGSGSDAPATPFAPPTTKAERLLAEIWQVVLEAERVGLDDDYFALGGDSIRAIVVVAKAEAAGLPMSTQDLFESRTIRRLAADLESRDDPASPTTGAAHNDRSAHPLTAVQEGILYHVSTTDRPVYVVQVTCTLQGDFDAPAFAEAWRTVVAEHAALRSRVDVGGDRPRLVIEPTVDVPIEFHDWRGVPPAAREEQLRDYLAGDLARGFDVAKGPLLRLAVFQTGPSGRRCVWTHHHLLLDGWSQQLVLVDVLDAYVELRSGRRPVVPSRRSTVDFADLFAGPDLREQRLFWQEYLRGFVEPIALTRAAAGPVGSRVDGTRGVVMTLDGRAAARLGAFCRSHGLTLATVVLAGWAMALIRATGAADVLFGATVSGRSAGLPGITEAVGMFINTVAVRVRYEPSVPVLPWLRELHRRQAEAAAYEHAPLTEVARWSEVPPGRPLFDSIVVIENFPTPIADVHPGAGLRISDVEATIDEDYPVVVEVLLATRVQIRVRFDAVRIGREAAEALAAELSAFLCTVATDPNLPVADLLVRLREDEQRRTASSRAVLHAEAAGRLKSTRREPQPDGA
jgi:nonribosomal peptide synthetase protein BlmV